MHFFLFHFIFNNITGTLFYFIVLYFFPVSGFICFGIILSQTIIPKKYFDTELRGWGMFNTTLRRNQEEWQI